MQSTAVGLKVPTLNRPPKVVSRLARTASQARLESRYYLALDCEPDELYLTLEACIGCGVNLSRESLERLQHPENWARFNLLNEGPLSILMPDLMRFHLGIDQDLEEYIYNQSLEEMEQEEVAAHYHLQNTIFPELEPLAPNSPNPSPRPPWPQLDKALQAKKQLLNHHDVKLEPLVEFYDQPYGPYIAYVYQATNESQVAEAQHCFSEFDEFLANTDSYNPFVLRVSGTTQAIEKYLKDLLSYLQALESLVFSLGELQAT